MSKEIENIASIIDQVRNSVWEDGYYLDYHRHSKTIARAIHERGYRRQVDVMREILDEIEDFIVNECYVTDHDVSSIYKVVRSIRNRYTMGLNYQERTNTIREVKELYNRVTKDPHIKQYRGYSATKSYGYDAETKKVIVKDGDFWFDNPSFHGG